MARSNWQEAKSFEGKLVSRKPYQIWLFEGKEEEIGGNYARYHQ